MKPHKHAELIKAWADGAEIEVRNTNDGGSEWHVQDHPWWNDHLYEYRIKPEPKPEPKANWMYVYYSKIETKMWFDDNPPEKFLYNSLYTYVGRIEVWK